MNPTWILKNIHENCKKMKLYKSLPIKKFDKKKIVIVVLERF